VTACKRHIWWHCAWKATDFLTFSEIVVSTGHDSEDGWEVDYSVTETVPSPEVSTKDDMDDDFLGGFLSTCQVFDPAGEYRKVTLHLATDSVEVHHVTRVNVSTESHSVSRNRRENCSGQVFSDTRIGCFAAISCS
jgi:hypothetical protein